MGVGGRDHQRNRPSAHQAMALGQLIQKGQPPLHMPRVQARERIIHQQDLRLERQRARQADSLLPAAPQGARGALRPGREFGTFQQFIHRRSGLALAQVMVVAQRQRDVLRNREVVKQLAAVEHQPEAQALFQARLFEDGHLFAEEPITALPGRHQAVGQHEEIALARTMHSGHNPVIAGVHGPINALGNHCVRVKQGTDGHAGHLDRRQAGLVWRVTHHVVR